MTFGVRESPNKAGFRLRPPGGGLRTNRPRGKWDLGEYRMPGRARSLGTNVRGAGSETAERYAQLRGHGDGWDAKFSGRALRTAVLLGLSAWPWG